MEFWTNQYKFSVLNQVEVQSWWLEHVSKEASIQLRAFNESKYNLDAAHNDQFKIREDPPAENIDSTLLQHMEFGRLERRRTTSSELWTWWGEWNTILTSDVVANCTQEMSCHSDPYPIFNKWFPDSSTTIIYSSFILNLFCF